MIKEILSSHAANLNRAWAHDRTQTIGASDVGQCARKTYWTKCEADPKHAAPRDADYVDGWGAKVRGTMMENTFWAPAMLRRYGVNLLYAGTEQRTFVSGFLSATPDGLVINQPPDALADLGIPDLTMGEGGLGCFMAECKTADPRSNLREAKAENVFQTQVQMGLVRELTDSKPNFSLLSYIDASFWDEVHEFVIPFEQKIFDAAKDRARTIMTASDYSELKPEGWIAGGRECEYCPFTKACNITRKSVPDQGVIADSQFVAEITDLARSIREFESTNKFNTERMRSMQDDLRNRLREKKVRKIPGVVTWSSVKGRKTYSSADMKEALTDLGVDIEQFASEGEPSDRLVITL